MNPHFRIALFVIAYSLFLILVSAPSVHAEITRTLQMGSTGQDVKELQVLLNSDPLTTVSSSGIGSSGKESEYFGILTKRAVEAFQKKYAPEVLFPAGIWQPTGIVGSYSRKKLNALAINQVKTSEGSVSTQVHVPNFVNKLIPEATQKKSNEATASTYSPFLTKNKPNLYNLSKYQAKHGDTVSVQGSGFLQSGNSIVFNASNRIDNLSSVNGSTITFTVPDSLQNSSYNLSIENKNGSSYSLSYGNFFTVTDNPLDPPKVSAVSPATVAFSESSVVTIVGSGFSKKSNDVYTGLGNVFGLPSSDGKTIQVQLSSLSEFKRTTLYGSALKKAEITVPIFVVVKNEAGISDSTQSFLLQY